MGKKKLGRFGKMNAGLAARAVFVSPFLLQKPLIYDPFLNFGVLG